MIKHFKLILLILLVLITFSVKAYNKGDIVKLTVSEDCSYCKEAENILKKYHIPFTVKNGDGPVPQLYVNDKYIGIGVEAVENYAKKK